MPEKPSVSEQSAKENAPVIELPDLSENSDMENVSENPEGNKAE